MSWDRRTELSCQRLACRTMSPIIIGSFSCQTISASLYVSPIPAGHSLSHGLSGSLSDTRNEPGMHDSLVSLLHWLSLLHRLGRDTATYGEDSAACVFCLKKRSLPAPPLDCRPGMQEVHPARCRYIFKAAIHESLLRRAGQTIQAGTYQSHNKMWIYTWDMREYELAVIDVICLRPLLLSTSPNVPWDIPGRLPRSAIAFLAIA